MTTEFDIRDTVGVKGVITGIRIGSSGVISYKVKLKDADGNIGFIEIVENNMLLVSKYNKEEEK